MLVAKMLFSNSLSISDLFCRIRGVRLVMQFSKFVILSTRIFFFQERDNCLKRHRESMSDLDASVSCPACQVEVGKMELTQHFASVHADMFLTCCVQVEKKSTTLCLLHNNSCPKRHSEIKSLVQVQTLHFFVVSVWRWWVASKVRWGNISSPIIIARLNLCSAPTAASSPTPSGSWRHTSMKESLFNIVHCNTNTRWPPSL